MDLRLESGSLAGAYEAVDWVESIAVGAGVLLEVRFENVRPAALLEALGTFARHLGSSRRSPTPVH
jgi:hypothetical protein